MGEERENEKERERERGQREVKEREKIELLEKKMRGKEKKRVHHEISCAGNKQF